MNDILLPLGKPPPVPKLPKPVGDFRPGDPIEFRSSAHGGCWRPGVVDRLLKDATSRGKRHRGVRIVVGPGVWIIRPLDSCRPLAGKLQRPQRRAKAAIDAREAPAKPARALKADVSRQVRQQRQRAAAGRCKCGHQPDPGKRRCHRCREVDRRRYARKKLAAAG